MNQINRRTFLHVLAGTAMLGSLSACSSGTTNPATAANDHREWAAANNLPITANGAVVAEPPVMLYNIALAPDHRMIFMRTVLMWPYGQQPNMDVVMAYEKRGERQPTLTMKSIMATSTPELRSEATAAALAVAIAGGAATGLGMGLMMPGASKATATATAISNVHVSGRNYDGDVILSQAEAQKSLAAVSTTAFKKMLDGKIIVLQM